MILLLKMLGVAGPGISPHPWILKNNDVIVLVAVNS